jgi:hypothetical protein
MNLYPIAAPVNNVTSMHQILCIDDDPTVLSSISRDFKDIAAELTLADTAE